MGIIGYYFRIKKITDDPNAVAKFSVKVFHIDKELD